MKTLATVWLILALTVVPSVLNLERLDCCVAVVVNMALAVLAARRWNPHMWNDKREDR